MKAHSDSRPLKTHRFEENYFSSTKVFILYQVDHMTGFNGSFKAFQDKFGEEDALRPWFEARGVDHAVAGHVAAHWLKQKLPDQKDYDEAVRQIREGVQPQDNRDDELLDQERSSDEESEEISAHEGSAGLQDEKGRAQEESCSDESSDIQASQSSYDHQSEECAAVQSDPDEGSFDQSNSGEGNSESSEGALEELYGRYVMTGDAIRDAPLNKNLENSFRIRVEMRGKNRKPPNLFFQFSCQNSKFSLAPKF